MMTIALGSLCFLLNVAVLNCDPGAAAYVEPAGHIPPEHWALVRTVEIWDEGYGQSNERTSTIRLPRKVRFAAVYHEVAHLVLWSQPELLASWKSIFWPRKKLRWGAPTSYAYTGPSEDFCEAYRTQIKGQLERKSPARYAWFRALLPQVVPRAGAQTVHGKGPP